jgi:hypothetical protein
MPTIRSAIIGAFAVASLLSVAATPAMATSTPTPKASVGSDQATSAVAPRPNAAMPQSTDGYLYVYKDAYFKGQWCKFFYDHSDWRYPEWRMPRGGQCFGYFIDPKIQDAVSSLWNNAAPSGRYSTVKLSRDIDNAGPYMCLRAGNYWADLSLGYERFNNGANANDQISSHKWVTSC